MIPGVRLVVLGKQGAGKGTQCVRLSHHYVVPHVSTGDMLRSEVKSRSSLGQRAQLAHGAGRAHPRRHGHGDGGRPPGRARHHGPRASCSTAARAPRSRPSRSTKIVAAVRPRPGDRPAGPDQPGDEAPGLAPGLRGLRRQLLDRRPAAGQLDVRRLRRRGGAARGRHRGGDRAPAQPLRGGDGAAARLVQAAQPAGRDQRDRLARRRDPAGGRAPSTPCASSRGNEAAP